MKLYRVFRVAKEVYTVRKHTTVIRYTYTALLVPFQRVYSRFYPINIPLSNRLAVKIKQFDNCKNILTDFGDWESDISQQILTLSVPN
jgi:hypothetical protein